MPVICNFIKGRRYNITRIDFEDITRDEFVEMKLDKHYTVPRLVALYDHDNPRGPDTDFYLSLAAEINPHRIIDVGCGTGTLTCELALEGRYVIGVDPSAEMLDVARRKPGGDRVQWLRGDAAALGEMEADLAIMTGNVAQVFLDDIEWAATLRHLYLTLRPGGCLAFESRNPNAREWEQWGREDTFGRIDTEFGRMKRWMEVVKAEKGRVHFVKHNVFEETGEDVPVRSKLRFRSKSELVSALEAGGFSIERVYGDWNRGPFTKSSRVMVFVAYRNSTAK